MKVYLVAGEPSGDKLGAALMAELKNFATFDLDYSGAVSYTHLTLPTILRV